MHDSPQNVAFRLSYLQQRLKNLVEIDGRLVPEYPEVFLDESYCHLDHSTANRWVQSNGGTVAEPGRQTLLVIFAAFVVYYDKEKRELQGTFVKDSVHIWPALGKAHIRKTDGQDDNVWSNVPEEIRQAGIMADVNDYHGNFNSEVFDALFRRLCQNLNDMNLGPCHIHLDGAKYHFHNLNKKPNASDKKITIQEWLIANDHGIPVSEKGVGHPPTKAELWNDVLRIQLRPDRDAIAWRHGSDVLRGPDHHSKRHQAFDQLGNSQKYIL
ncbi:hypothetical protein BGZ65_008491 [Modicella reniformis]|uniref:Uncharacterized protein n=1 Tax=Modicella reniformis TaxID=1440133 RepID=A0A9P6LRU0_9FUNG|nr:hypothetical protein BGZ65_008491 [Modicella reniformis]